MQSRNQESWLIWGCLAACLLFVALPFVASAQQLTRQFTATWDSVADATSYCVYSDTAPDMASRYAQKDAMFWVCTPQSSDPPETLVFDAPVNESGPNAGTNWFAVTAIPNDPARESLFSVEVSVVTPLRLNPPTGFDVMGEVVAALKKMLEGAHAGLSVK